MPKKPALPRPDVGALLDSAALPEKTVEVCLRGDLVAQFEDLERELRDQRTSTQTMADRGLNRQVAEQIEAVREQMRAASVVFTFRGLNRRDWTALMGAHPPRDSDQDDQLVGFNRDSFWLALIRACVVEPDLTDEQWERLDENLSSMQFDQLADAAMAVSRRKVDVPFSFASSATLAPDETSKQPSA